MQKPRIGKGRYSRKLKPSKDRLPSSEQPSTTTKFKTLRYTLQTEVEQGRLAQLTQRMCDLKLLKEPMQGIAGKVLMEMVLTMDLITVEHLIEYRNAKLRK